MAFGQTFGGRYLSVFFVYKPDTGTAVIISARNMSDKERRAYHDTDVSDVSFTIARAVQIEAELLVALERQAAVRGVSLETLVNLWLQQKLNEEARPAAA